MTTNGQTKRSPVEILLVEDNPGDVRLTQEALKEGKICNNLHIVEDGEEAMSFLRQEGQYTESTRPQLILLDLHLPKKDGREVLAEMRGDPALSQTEVIILTTSESDQDVLQTYNLSADRYITKPVNLEQFVKVVRSINGFCFAVVPAA
ncbi:MAG: response regulator [Candidatus Binatia bacterium]